MGNIDRQVNEAGDQLETLHRGWRLSTILDAVAVGLWDFDVAKASLEFDDGMYRLYGLNRAEFPDPLQANFQAIHPDDRDRILVKFNADITAGLDRTILEFRIIKPDQTIRYLQANIAVKRDQDGNALRIFGVDTDITEKKEIENQLIQTLNALNFSAIVSSTDNQGALTQVNDHFCEVTGYSREELLGKTHRIINSGFHTREFFADLWATLLAEKSWHGEFCNRRKDGTEYWVQCGISPILDPVGQIQGYLAIQFDISKQKHLQREMVYTSKMASLGEMAAGIAHEINNPLAIIHGLAVQLKMKLQKVSRTVNHLADPIIDEMETTIKRIAKIIKGLQAISRTGDQDEFQPAGIKSILEDTLALCASRLKTLGISLSVPDLDDSIEIECRRVQISQVLLNLINNARDAVEHSLDPWIKIEFQITDQHIFIKVIDSGLGIDKSSREKIFLPFFTTKDVGKGTGLGLSISKAIALDHGGQLTCDHEARNTCFIIQLPRAHSL